MLTNSLRPNNATPVLSPAAICLSMNEGSKICRNANKSGTRFFNFGSGFPSHLPANIICCFRSSFHAGRFFSALRRARSAIGWTSPPGTPQHLRAGKQQSQKNPIRPENPILRSRICAQGYLRTVADARGDLRDSSQKLFKAAFKTRMPADLVFQI